jgi:hypothetical protein
LLTLGDNRDYREGPSHRSRELVIMFGLRHTVHGHSCGADFELARRAKLSKTRSQASGRVDRPRP